ncbi:MAG: hypothetical protein LBB45_06305 [Methanobrevibacter sp.]|nr:hypothetical protein [Candidatus Methanovirga basalitermitum]
MTKIIQVKCVVFVDYINKDLGIATKKWTYHSILPRDQNAAINILHRASKIFFSSSKLRTTSVVVTVF